MARVSRLLFVDGSAGASGDMLLGALVDLGLPFARLRRGLAGLALDGWTIRSRRVERCGLSARKIDVRVRREQPKRDWKAIRRVLTRADLKPRVRRRSLAIFRRLIEAEAAAHGRSPERIHLHEAGAVDAIVDVVGTCIGLEELAVEQIVVSPLTTGFGRVSCAHGDYPVPAPATLGLLHGVPARAGEIEAERLTPTGAAVLTTLADHWSELPPMRPLALGYGAGDLELERTPNLLRMVLGEATTDVTQPAHLPVCVLECTLDDSTPQALAHAAETLLELGALEVFTAPVTMKKGRPGHQLTVLSRPERRAELTRVILEETSTLGLRWRLEERLELERSFVRVRTRYGTVAVKVGRLDGRVLQVWPEYAGCAELARGRGVPLVEVQQAALAAFRRRGSKRS
jgi:uncharacterized protein (TIGR00299 family) protein